MSKKVIIDVELLKELFYEVSDDSIQGAEVLFKELDENSFLIEIVDSFDRRSKNFKFNFKEFILRIEDIGYQTEIVNKDNDFKIFILS